MDPPSELKRECGEPGLLHGWEGRRTVLFLWSQRVPLLIVVRRKAASVYVTSILEREVSASLMEREDRGTHPFISKLGGACPASVQPISHFATQAYAQFIGGCSDLQAIPKNQLVKQIKG